MLVVVGGVAVVIGLALWIAGAIQNQSYDDWIAPGNGKMRLGQVAFLVGVVLLVVNAVSK